ncbi:DUF3047 domain-containing protein [Azoarcus sp. CIB]|uniref:DUF3047 domain-containing protein n=1 Tax=Aromatoleum sp. (strain CIB) TaxID=198107 RepID=UPI00067C5B2F|nr:DUF3047 domain-containing protein [Azoarcus sp. CIB]
MRRLPFALLGAAILALAPTAWGAPSPVWVGRFGSDSDALPEPWRVVRLNNSVPATRYRLVYWDGINAIEAHADRSMALLARPVDVDLRRTPTLCWHWRVEGIVTSADMTTKRGDDYAARVYVAFRLPPDELSLATRAKLSLARSLYGSDVPDAAISYVWDNRHPVGTRRPNAYTERTLMVVQRTGDRHVRTWVPERVNVLKDAREAFGTDRVELELLAIAADTDNTGEQVRSGFADIHFVGENENCRIASDPREMGTPPE